jgi:hypothetical protein
VVPHSRVQAIRQSAEEFVFLFAPEYFTGVGAFYKNFTQVSDEEVQNLLNNKTGKDNKQNADKKNDESRKLNKEETENKSGIPDTEETFSDLIL